MKNQYFGDINDYRKYGLLRRFAAAGLSTTVAWMLTPDDGSSDGRRLDYLSKPEKWERYDPRLYANLKALLSGPVARQVSLVERFGALPEARFYREPVPRERALRQGWLEGLLKKAPGSDLVFFDPDNGLEVPSAPMGRRSSTRYVYWSEVTALFRSGFSLLIYQHFPREPRPEFIAGKVEQLVERTGAAAVEAFETANVLFLVASQERHVEAVGEAMRTTSVGWQGQITACGFWDVPRADAVKTVPQHSNKLATAFTYALDLHADQVRKQTGDETAEDGIPYISHLMAVTALVLEHGGDEDEAIAALLHDGPEDRGGRATLKVIRARFGERVAQIVEECSDTLEEPKPEWWARKRAYHRNLREASAGALLVSAADKVHNAESTLADVRELGAGVWTRFRQGRTGSLWNYANLLEIYRGRASGKTVRLVDRLERALDGLFVDEDEKVAARGWDRGREG